MALTKEQTAEYLQEREGLMSPNVLADRYASNDMLRVFSPKQRVLDERELWIAVMKGQASLGLDIPPHVIAAYEDARAIVNLDSIRARERQSRHSEKAKIDEFDALAGGHGRIHLGMTSRDLTDNIEQMQMRNGLVVVRNKTVATLAKHAERALEGDAIYYADRTHNMIAQPTTVGKLFSTSGQELMLAFNELDHFIDSYPLRGLKGATGTQTDQLELLKDPAKVEELDQKVAEHLGFTETLDSVGQIYPRSLDFAAISKLYYLMCGPSSFATTARLMAGNDQFNEGFKKGQSGSSAMPYKMNSRSLERVSGFKIDEIGKLMSAAANAGDQWYGGDVRDSVPRRVILADSLFSADGMLETYLTVLQEMGYYPEVMNAEINIYAPFLAGTKIMMRAVEQGLPRELAHTVIKEHSVAVVSEMRTTGTYDNNLAQRLSSDERMNLDRQQMEDIIATPMSEQVGMASAQVKRFVGKVEKIVAKYPDAANYEPMPIL